jgi:hypothetical protein
VTNPPTPGASAELDEDADDMPLLPMRMHPVVLGLVALADVLMAIGLASMAWDGQFFAADSYWWTLTMFLTPLSCCVVPAGVWLWMVWDRTRHGAAGWKALSRARIATECAIMLPMVLVMIWGSVSVAKVVIESLSV